MSVTGARRIACGAILGVALCWGAPAARADWLADLTGKDPGLLAVSAGMFDFLHNNKAWEGRAEYDFAHGYYFVHPMMGVFATNRKGGFAYAGFDLDLHIGNHFVIVPNAAMGYYHQGDGKDLGEAFEFKTGARFDYRFEDDSRIGIAFDHISNAGFSSKNPGEENILLVFSFPIGSW